MSADPRIGGARGQYGFVSVEMDKAQDGRWTLTFAKDLGERIVVSGTAGQLWQLVEPIARALDAVRDKAEKVCAFCQGTDTELFPVDARFGAADCHSGCLADHGRRQSEYLEEVS